MYKSPLTLEALLVLDTIERRGSFAAAAEQLNKVPSALSYIIQKLEDQLNVTLFVRQGRRSVLTPAGAHLLVEGRKVLAAVSNIAEQTQTISHGWEPKIKIAYDSILDTELIFEVIAEFLVQYPSIELDIREEVMNGTWESLIQDEVDLVIGAAGPKPKQQGIRTVSIGNLEHIFVACAEHPILQIETPLSSEDIRQFRTVVVHDSVKSEIARSTNLIEESQHFYVSSVSQKIDAILAGIGVGFLPKNRIEDYLEDGDLIEVPFIGQTQISESLLGWKTVNKGKGLIQLRSALEAAFSE